VFLEGFIWFKVEISKYFLAIATLAT